MTQHSLGRLERVDLREVWQSEPGDFTPWLAGEENLALIGETVGLELELEAQEKEVGPFRADLLCKDTATDSWVLIENQLERTDHNHLGQFLTYAAGLNAVTIVWVAGRFADDHRAAIDWLNEITTGGVNFFALEIELWRIGDSLAAPKFNVVSQPNDWTKTVSSAASQADGLSETQRLQQEYWTAFSEHLSERGSHVRPTKPPPQHWMNFAIGRSQFTLQSYANTRDKRIAIGLVLSGPNATTHYRLLEQDKEAIEEEIGAALEWTPAPERKESRIMLRNPGADPARRDEWPGQHRWLAETLEAFDKAFRPRVRSLDAADYVPGPDEEDEPQTEAG